MSNILDKLNDEQRRPAEATEGAVLVTAGAGSGKTRLLTHRIAHLIEDNGVLPSNILAITFTNKAANEMKERLAGLNLAVQEMWICTFHAMCSKILRMNASLVGLDSNFSIYGDAEKDRLIKRILQQDAEFVALEKNKLKVDTVAWHISNAKNELLSPSDYSEVIKHDKYEPIITRAYINYQRELINSNAVDFDDMLIKAYELLRDNERVREFYQNKFKYIHVDEFQDTNVVQYKLVKILSGKYGNVFVVGDEDQCIYSWRGAKFTNVQKFIDEYKDVKIFKLEQNYRSTKNILTLANKIIKNNDNRLDKKLWTENLEGDKVSYVVQYSDLDEAEFVATTIKNMVTNDGYKYSDFAVLMRINSLSRVIEEKFLNYQIPYDVYGGFKFFERKEVKDALSYLKIVSNPKDNDSFIRVLSFPKKGIGDATIDKIMSVSMQTGMSAYEVARSGLGLDNSTIRKLQPVVSVLQPIIEDKASYSISGLMAKLIDVFSIKTVFSRLVEEELTKIMNIETLEKSIVEFEEANENATIDDYLQSITLSRDIDTLDEEENHASIMTIHSAKGLEFRVVFLVGLVDGVLPLSRAINSMDSNELEEERRLMYVAVTRAKEKLFITRPSSKFNFESRRTEGTMESRFIREAGLSSLLYGTPKPKDETTSSYRRFTSDDLYDDGVTEARTEKVDSSKIDQYKKFKVGTKVFHKSFGKGEVIVAVTDYASAFVTIKFEIAGVKTLSLKFAPLEIIE